MHTAQQNHAPQNEPRNDGAPQPETQSVPQTNLSSTARMSRAWRCFVGTLVLLGVFIVHGCGGGGGSSINNGNGNSGSATVSIQVRDRNTGALLPATIVVSTPAAGATAQPTATAAPLTVRLVGKNLDKSVSFNDPQAGAQFGSVRPGTYQVFVGGQRSSPDIVVASSTTSGGATQTFTVLPGLSNNSQFLSKVTIQGLTLLSVPPIATATSSAAATPTQSSSCPSSEVATGAYLVRVVNYNTKRVVAVYAKPNLARTYSITNIPLDVAGGNPISTTYYLQIFTDPSDTTINTSFSGQSALFTIRAGSSGTATLPDICATVGGLIRTPTSTTTPGIGTPTATSSGVDFPTPIGGS